MAEKTFQDIFAPVLRYKKSKLEGTSREVKNSFNSYNTVHQHLNAALQAFREIIDEQGGKHIPTTYFALAYTSLSEASKLPTETVSILQLMDIVLPQYRPHFPHCLTPFSVPRSVLRAKVADLQKLLFRLLEQHQANTPVIRNVTALDR